MLYFVMVCIYSEEYKRSIENLPKYKDINPVTSEQAWWKLFNSGKLLEAIDEFEKNSLKSKLVIKGLS
jgi:hypothetical protein